MKRIPRNAERSNSPEWLDGFCRGQLQRSLEDAEATLFDAVALVQYQVVLPTKQHRELDALYRRLTKLLETI